MTSKRARRLAAEFRAVADALRHVSRIIAQLEVSGEPGIVGSPDASIIALDAPAVFGSLEALADRLHPQP